MEDDSNKKIKRKTYKQRTDTSRKMLRDRFEDTEQHPSKSPVMGALHLGQAFKSTDPSWMRDALQQTDPDPNLDIDQPK